MDTNTIAYLYLPTAQTAAVERLLAADSEWVAPRLWRSEMRNLLALCMRKGILGVDSACQIQNQAQSLIPGNEYELDSLSVPSLAQRSGCSACDCEFVALALSLAVWRVTADKRFRNMFPTLAVTAKEYLSAV